MSVALGCRVLAATTRHLQVLCLCNGAAIKLRLVELACGCSMVCGAGGLEVNELEVRARLCRRHSSAHCLPPRPGTCRCFVFATEPPSSSDWSS